MLFRFSVLSTIAIVAKHVHDCQLEFEDITSHKCTCKLRLCQKSLQILHYIYAVQEIELLPNSN